MAGFVLALVMTMGVEAFSAVVHPVPPGVDLRELEACRAHVARYPAWVLAAVVVAWGATTMLASWLATSACGQPADNAAIGPRDIGSQHARFHAARDTADRCQLAAVISPVAAPRGCDGTIRQRAKPLGPKPSTSTRNLHERARTTADPIGVDGWSELGNVDSHGDLRYARCATRQPPNRLTRQTGAAR